MAKIMKQTALLSTLLTVIFVILYGTTESGIVFTMAITFGMISYHFVMRLLIGSMINFFLNNHVNYRKKWFQVSELEEKLYKKLKVRKWKGKMATYDPSCFDNRIHSWDVIAQAMCQAEIVHELIIVFSFLPVFAAIPFGALPVFVITSVLAACFDAAFVIMQRYNRPRVIKLIEKSKRSKLPG